MNKGKLTRLKKLDSGDNDEVVQNANTKDMIFTVAETVEQLSAVMILNPGDLLVMGTPVGVGMARQPPLWLTPGDICEEETGNIGLLSNIIVS